MFTYIGLFIFTLYLNGVVSQQRIHLRDVQVLTFQKDHMTAGRRSQSVPQLMCVGGNAMSYSHLVNSVQCQNQGWNGMTVDWKCESQLDSRYKLGQVTVNCEGYDYAGDQFILAGSCGLEYELVLNPQAQGQYTGTTINSQPQRIVETYRYDPWTDTTYVTQHREDEYTNTIVAIFLFVCLCTAIFLLVCQSVSTPVHVRSTPYVEVMPQVPIVSAPPMYHYSWYNPYRYTPYFSSYWGPSMTTRVVRTTYPSSSMSTSSGSSSRSETTTSYGTTKTR